MLILHIANKIANQKHCQHFFDMEETYTITTSIIKCSNKNQTPNNAPFFSFLLCFGNSLRHSFSIERGSMLALHVTCFAHEGNSFYSCNTMIPFKLEHLQLHPFKERFSNLQEQYKHSNTTNTMHARILETSFEAQTQPHSAKIATPAQCWPTEVHHPYTMSKSCKLPWRPHESHFSSFHLRL